MLKILLVFLSSAHISRNSIICPKRSWTEYKRNIEGPWSLSISNYKDLVDIFVVRNTTYKCFNNNNVTFRTNRRGSYSMKMFINYQYLVVGSTGYGTCDKNCSSKNVSVYVLYYDRNRKWPTRRRWSKWSGMSELKLLGKFVYLNKNCNKLYWTSWSMISNCSTSSHSNFHRLCVDCDGDDVDTRFCIGNATKLKECRHFWSEWTEAAPCVNIVCGETAEQIRKRKCLYGDGIEANKQVLCSNGSSTDVEKQPCIKTDLTNCTAHVSSGMPYTGLFVGIGVAVTLIFALFVLLIVVKYRRHKAEQFRSYATTQQSFSLSNLAADSLSTQPRKHETERDQPAEPNVYFQNEETLANDYDSIQPSEPNLLKIHTLNNPDISTDYQIHKPVQNGSLLHSTVQTTAVKNEQNNVYSALENPSNFLESDYSCLDRK